MRGANRVINYHTRNFELTERHNLEPGHLWFDDGEFMLFILYHLHWDEDENSSRERERESANDVNLKNQSSELTGDAKSLKVKTHKLKIGWVNSLLGYQMSIRIPPSFLLFASSSTFLKLLFILWTNSTLFEWVKKFFSTNSTKLRSPLG